jgi:hypothetical protein
MRRALDILTIVSALLLIALTLLWISSYTWSIGFGFSDQVNGDAPAHRSCEISSLRGSILYEHHVRAGMPVAPLQWDFDCTRRSDINPFVREYYEAHPAFHFSRSSDGMGDSALFVALPHWLFIATSAILPVFWVTRLVGRRRRLRTGRCTRCGYDLRGTPAQCPECGEVTAKD